ncbi:MAG: DUF4367 domain-containing protein [Anaerolineales bacterium]
MDNKNIHSILQDALEEKIPSAQIELWPAVKASLVAKKHSLTQQGEKMNTTKPRRMARAVLITLMIVVLLALAFITPQGRAFAQSILQFFVRTESDAIPVPTQEPVTWVDVTPNMPAVTKTPQPAIAIFANDCGDYGSPTCTVEQIRSKVDFTVKEPASIPEGLYFVGATGGPDSIYLLYYYENQSGSLSVTVERWAGTPSPQTDIIGASAIVEEVNIDGLTGEYFKGIFVSESEGSVATWDPNFGVETLRWVDNGISYTMQYSYPSAALEKEGMAALAESMTTEPVAKQPMPVPTEDPYLWDPSNTYNLSVPQAEQQAGFKLLLPTRLPEIFSFIGASYDAEHGIVTAFYLLDQNLYGPTAEGITLRQQIAPDPANCFLCDISIGDYNAVKEGNPDYVMVVPANANLEIVQIGTATGKYIQGVWSGTDCCGWQWDPTPPAKTLRWWSDGMAFEMIYFGENIDKADMITIAESVK